MVDVDRRRIRWHLCTCKRRVGRNFWNGTGSLIILIGLTTGGILVDHFGLFESPKKTMNVQKIVGICVMVFGATLIKLL